MDIENLGQVFTPEKIVFLMCSLIKNSGRVLEPSGGDGAFSKNLSNCTVIEIDSSKAPTGALTMDFFDYPITEKFDTIIGNPPYVRYRDILESTKMKLVSQLFDLRSNLYLFFIEKCIHHLNERGELIFIVPREFLKSTSSVTLNRFIMEVGTITHLIDLGDSRLFERAVPNCVVFRFEKGNFARETLYCEISGSQISKQSIENLLNWKTTVLSEVRGQLIFANGLGNLTLKDIASVKVGAVSGADDIFADEVNGNRDFVCSETVRTGETRRMIWPIPGQPPSSALLKHKERLLQRRIKSFDETNWWTWGRGYPENQEPRIYVNGKTRVHNPFFSHPCKNFDGSVLAIFPKYEVDLLELCDALNHVDWNLLGFCCDGRFIFSQRSLENAPLPADFAKFIGNKSILKVS